MIIVLAIIQMWQLLNISMNDRFFTNIINKSNPSKITVKGTINLNKHFQSWINDQNFIIRFQIEP